jgi:gluconate 2-dehydrogenase gamma chain
MHAEPKNQPKKECREEVMPSETDDGRKTPRDLSRRNLFKQAAGVAAAISGTGVATNAPAVAQAPAVAAKLEAPKLDAPRREALETLTAAEADTLEAIVARIIPTDENGPGAAEARAAHYIDRALTGPLRGSRAAYAAGLAAIDDYARSAKGAAFGKLAAKDQDAVLTDLEKNVATGFTPNAAAFFNLVRTHTIQGTFCDPYYGGNANFIGWDLLGYPGLRMVVTADEQRMGARAKPVRQSAYDDASFTMSGASRGGQHHGR